MNSHYIEDFVDGPGGWWGWDGNHVGLQPLGVGPGWVETISPWWIDYNHAPPGAGYLHMLFCLTTKGPLGEQMKEVAGTNPFIDSGCSRDLRGARIVVRIRGDVIARGANVVLLIQSTRDGLVSPWALTGSPITVGPDWQDTELTLDPDPQKWTSLKGRHDRQDFYGELPLESCLADVNVNLMLIYFPLDVVPMRPNGVDPHILRPERDYPVWRSRLPEGWLQLDRFEIHPARS